MLNHEGVLRTANARIAPIATTISPVLVLIGRFYPPQQHSCHPGENSPPAEGARSAEQCPRRTAGQMAGLACAAFAKRVRPFRRASYAGRSAPSPADLTGCMPPATAGSTG